MDLAKLFSLEGKTALVTGGSRGIGYMIAESLIAAGAKTYICARKEPELREAHAKLAAKGECEWLSADLSSPDAIAKLARDLAEKEGRLNILVNNAGATWGAPMAQYPRASFEKVLSVNVTAPFFLTQALMPLLCAGAETKDDPARIINIASIDALRPPVWESYAYGASKAAIVMLTRHLAGTLAAQNITVNAIAPGLFPSKMTAFLFADEEAPEQKFNIPLGRPGRTEDIGGAAIYLASAAGSYLTGIVLPVAGGSATAE